MSSWKTTSEKLSKEFSFDSFSDAIQFMSIVSIYCDRKDHHPEWKNVYNKVFVDLTTHSEGGVTNKDIELSAQMDRIYVEFYNKQ